MKNTQWMKPPWHVFEYTQLSMGWRMGGGEDYLSQWEKWFTYLSQEEQHAYITQYPEPEDWFEFYHLRVAQNQEEYHASLERLPRLRKAYCEQQYERALYHENTGSIEHAVMFLGNILFFNQAYPVWDERQLRKTVKRYKVLKQQLVQHMALNPTIRKSWNALHTSEHRIPIAIPRVTLTTKEYERMQKDIYIPSPFGRTWTKYFEDDALYIHRHWNEPCLFLVIVQQAELSYHIAEAWMNSDPAIPKPLTKPKREPSELLSFLLRQFFT